MRRVASLACALLVGPVGWGAEPKREPMRVRAMTFNIRHSKARDRLFHWRDRRGLVAEVFRRHRPDFVGVQEALPPQLADLLEALPGYRHVGRSRDADATGGEAVPVFYRHERWTVKASGTFWLSDTPEQPGSRGWGNPVPRIVTWGRFVEKATGRDVHVLNTHFCNRSQQAREKSAALLARRILALRQEGTTRVLITGDFNSGEASDPILYLKGQPQGAPVRLVDTFRVLHPRATGVGTCHAWSGLSVGPKIDYVFALPDAKVLDARVLFDARKDLLPSDHFPVLADVAFSGNRKETRDEAKSR